jgi:5-formyltetrahydrofolate cyclo-ligase
MPTELETAKTAARNVALLRRAGCDPALGVRLTAHVLRDCPPPKGAIIAGFWPLPGEIDIRPLLLALHARGHTLCLPESPPRGNPLIFRRWSPGDPLTPGRFNTQHPSGDAITPDYVLVPLLAFDSAGNRLGYGAGYYDRTLATLPHAYRLGCAFAAQKITALPVGPDDIPLHAIATENGVKPYPMTRAHAKG